MLFFKSLPFDQHELITKLSDDDTGTFQIFSILEKFDQFFIVTYLIRWMILILKGLFYLVFSHPFHDGNVGDAKDPLDLAIR